MNQVQLFGRLTRDPELRYTQQSKAVAGFTLAINRIGGNNEADFFDCTAWEKQAENITNSCRKGHRLLVWGRLQQEKWTDQQGQQRTSVKVVVTGFSYIEPAQNAGQTPPQGQGGYQQPPQGPPPGQYGQPPQGPPQGGYQQPPGPGGYPPPYQPPTGGAGYVSPPQGGMPPGGYQQQPPGPGQYGQPPAGGQRPPQGPPPGQYQGQQGYSGNLDDIPF